MNLEGGKKRSFVKKERNSSSTAAALLMMMVTMMTITWGLLRDSFHAHTSDLFLSSALPLKVQPHMRRVGSRLKLHLEIKPHSSLSFAWGAEHHCRGRRAVQRRVGVNEKKSRKVADEEVRNKDGEEGKSNERCCWGGGVRWRRRAMTDGGIERG